jgi:hypothetical protein
MSIPIKFMIGFFSLVISMMVVMSWFDGQTSYITSNQMTDISNMGDSDIVTGVQTTGETSTNVQWRSGLWGTIMKWVDFDFSFWYSSIETGWTKTTCQAAGGLWDDGSSLCGFPNQWDIVHTMIFRPIGWGIVLAFISVGIGKLFGVF